MRNSEVEAIEELIAKHQKTETHHIEKLNKMRDWIAVELEDSNREAWENLADQARQKSVAEKKVIRELAGLLGKQAPSRSIRTSGLFVILPTEVV